MHFTIDKKEKYSVVTLEEQKLNTLISAELKSELLILNGQGVTNIILDLTETQYCDSSGLSAILVGNRVCRNANGTFVITGVSEPISKLITISHLDQVLNITTSVDDAVGFLVGDDVERSTP